MEKKVTYEDKEVQVNITSHSATIIDGMRLDNLRMHGLKSEETDQLIRTAQTVLWPDCIACSIVNHYAKAEGKAEDGSIIWSKEQVMTFQEFLTLPQQLVEQWCETVFELNPHWSPVAITEEIRKKAMPPMGGSEITS